MNENMHFFSLNPSVYQNNVCQIDLPGSIYRILNDYWTREIKFI